VADSSAKRCKQRGIVRKDGTIKIQKPELAEGTVVEVIILVEQEAIASDSGAIRFKRFFNPRPNRIPVINGSKPSASSRIYSQR
jgi:hypothetical protein